MTHIIPGEILRGVKNISRREEQMIKAVTDGLESDHNYVP